MAIDYPPLTHYCVSFLDLLGMKRALKGQALIPIDPSPAEREALDMAIRSSVGAILQLQHLAQGIIQAGKEYAANSTTGLQFTGDKRAAWDAMSYTKVQIQPWSDGLVYFSNLADPA